VRAEPDAPLLIVNWFRGTPLNEYALTCNTGKSTGHQADVARRLKRSFTYTAVKLCKGR